MLVIYDCSSANVSVLVLGGESFPKCHLLLWSCNCKNAVFCVYLNALKTTYIASIIWIMK